MSRILSSSAHNFGVWIRNQNFKFIVWCMQKTIKCWRLSKWLCWSNAWWQYWNNFVYYNCWFTSQLLLYGRIVKCKSISLSRHDKTFYFSTQEIDFLNLTQYTILTNYCQDLKSAEQSDMSRKDKTGCPPMICSSWPSMYYNIINSLLTIVCLNGAVQYTIPSSCMYWPHCCPVSVQQLQSGNMFWWHWLNILWWLTTFFFQIQEKILN